MRLVKVGEFEAPVYLTAPPGDKRRLFIVEQAGEIVVVRGGKPQAQPFLDIRSKVTAGGEQGLLSMAFAPDYAQSGLFYVYYTEKSGTESIWEYHRASEDRADANSARLVLRMDDPEPNHNGGLMIFGPDKLMYVGTGDGGGGNDQHGTRGNAQALSSLLGKILRIDPPAVGRAGRTRSRPRTRSSDARATAARSTPTGCATRGASRSTAPTTTSSSATSARTRSRRSISSRRGAGAATNFGWRPWEGRRRNFNEPAPHAIFPVITHTHQAGFCSITGGYIARDRGVPGLYGRYVYGDYCNCHLRVATLRAGKRASSRTLSVPTISGVASFGQDAPGRLYVVSVNGPVYRFAAR